MSDIYEIYNNQVGGHTTILCPRTGDLILKQGKENEIEFYEKLQQTQEDNQLLSFLPKFYGTTVINQSPKVYLME